MDTDKVVEITTAAVPIVQVAVPALIQLAKMVQGMSAKAGEPITLDEAIARVMLIVDDGDAATSAWEQAKALRAQRIAAKIST